MASTLHCNAVITGWVDCYCLVCESYLRSEEEAHMHIEKPVHKRNLNSIQYFEKYKADRVRKVKKGYFCEYCNLLFSTSMKVEHHVAEKKHNDNKNYRLLKRVGNSIVVCDELFICEKAWNGFIDDTCAVCNTEFDNENLHKTEQKHIINLIQKKIEFSTDKSVYRMVDDTCFHCLICNKILILETIDAHVNDAEHKRLYAKCRDVSTMHDSFLKRNENINPVIDSPPKPTESTWTEKVYKQTVKNKISSDEKGKGDLNNKNRINFSEEIKEQNKNTESSLRKNSAPGNVPIHKDSKPNIECDNQTEHVAVNPGPKYDKAKILDCVPEFQKNGIDINFETEIAFCKKCYIDVELEFVAIEKHIEYHKTKPKEINEYLKSFAMNKDHNRTVLKSNTNGHTNEKDENHKTENVSGQSTSVPKFDDDLSNKSLVEYMPVVESRNNGVQVSTDKTKNKTFENGHPSTSTHDDPIAFAKENHLTYNKSHNTAFCRLCVVRIPSSLRSMQEHVFGAIHKKKVSSLNNVQKNTHSTIKKCSLEKFIKTRNVVESLFFDDDVVINDKYCLTYLSYMLITKHAFRMRCQACEVNLESYEIEEHVNEFSHVSQMDATPVVLSLDAEFIREVRPGLYHCGYCNLIMGDWEDVNKHLSCQEHSDNKARARRRLDMHLPHIIRHRQELQFRMMMLHRLFS